MSQNLIFRIAMAAVAALCASHPAWAQADQQDLIVFHSGRGTVVRGYEDGRIVKRDANADDALQWAVDQLAAQGGGKIEIGRGEYIINKPIRLASFITLSGSGRATVLKLGPANKTGVVLMANGKDQIVLSGFTCQGIPASADSAGIVFDAVGDSEIRNVTARDFSGSGIWLRGMSFMNKVVSCSTLGNGRAGILLSGNNGKTGRGGDWVPNLIMGNNSIGENGNAVELLGSTCTNIVACVAYQPKGHGFYIHGSSNSTLLEGSRCFQGAKDAILVENSNEVNISSNIMCWNRGNDLELKHVRWGTVSGNNFIDSGGEGQLPGPGASGINMHDGTENVTVTGNSVWNWPEMKSLIYGIYESADCQNNQITDNIINNVLKEAVFAGGKDTMVSGIKVIKDFYRICNPNYFKALGLSADQAKAVESYYCAAGTHNPTAGAPVPWPGSPLFPTAPVETFLNETRR